MTENKRFKIVDEQFISYYGGTGYKISNEECGFWLWHNKNESQKVCDKLNSILDENEQLKKENYELHKRLGDFEPFEDHIKERTSKTSINDIVRLVKTDESTDSVQLKKEAQLNICERKLLGMEEDRDYYKTKPASLEDGYIKLQKENKQLKQHNTELITKIDFLERIIDGDVE